VTAQIIYAEITGDKVLAAATSKELSKYGLTIGLKNYAASYCTGLLLARRLLKKLNLDELYAGNEELTGDVVQTEVNGRTFFVEEVSDEKKPFRALLDIGTVNTTTGARVFGVLKGASDGGLDIPHSNKRFPGYNRDTKSFEADVHKDHILGEHIAEYMREMEEDDEENYNKHFAKFIEADVDADGLAELYEKVHAAIREDPEREPSTRGSYDHSQTQRKTPKKTAAERKASVAAKKATFAPQDDDEEEEEEAEEADDEE
jgi:large subunit ribosomal protein L5e